MQTIDLPYQEYLDGHFYYLMTVTTLGPWRIESASQDGVYLLLLVNHEEQSVVLCRYESFQERYADVEMLRRMRPDGAAGAAVAAWLRPTPPTLSDSDAKPLPGAEDETEGDADAPRDT